MVKVSFSVLLYQAFKAFMEAMKYTLFEITTTRLKFLYQFSFLKNLIRVWAKGVKLKRPTANSDNFSGVLEVMIYEVGLYFCSFCFVFSFLWGRVKNFIFYTFPQMNWWINFSSIKQKMLKTNRQLLV